MRRAKSSIDQLPAESREKLEAMLANPYNGLTYKDMVEAIEEDCGIALSRSAIHRYAQRYNRDLERIKPVAEGMQRIEAYMQEHSPADLSAQILALVQDGLLRRILDGQDDIDEIPIADAIKMSLQAQRVSTSVYRYRDQTFERCEANSEETAAAHMEWLRHELRNNPDLLKELVDDGTAEHTERAGAASRSGNPDGTEPEMVCAPGGDGFRGGCLPPAEPSELPRDASEKDRAGAEERAET